MRERLRSHFANANQRQKSQRLEKETAAIETIRTAGNFGASVLELQHIKERQPLLNKQSRKKKQLVVAYEQSEDGYLYPEIERVKRISAQEHANVLGVFKSKKQAENRIQQLAREYELCMSQLQLGTELRKGDPCFYFQLGQCRGACVGEDSPASYNRRFRTAFDRYSVQSWPADGPVAIKESLANRTDKFVIDNWVITQAVTSIDGDQKDFFRSVAEPATFNYDTYKQIASVLFRNGNRDQAIIETL